MIYYEGTKLSPNLYVESVDGLYDFPKAKNSGEDWDNEPFLKFPTSQKKWQFESRKIKVNCFIIGDTFEAAQTEFLTTLGTKLQTTLQFSDLRLMTIPSYSNRAYYVEFVKPAFVSTNYDTGVCVFRFTLTFNEPQPFNIQLRFKFDIDTAFELSIGRESIVTNTSSENQIYINDVFRGFSHEYDLGEFNANYTGTFYAGKTYYMLIYGDIDKLTKIFSSVTVQDETIANYYFRNGTIS